MTGSNPGQGSSIVYLDDSVETLDEVQELFRAVDLDCKTFARAGEAIAYCVAQQHLVLLVDLDLGGTSGLTFIQDLEAKRDDDQQFDYIVLTGSTNFADAKAALTTGVTAYLNKPVDVSQLISTTLEVLERQQGRSREKLRQASIIAGFTDQLEALERRVDDAYTDALNLVTETAELKDPETGEHIQRLSLYTERLAIELGLDSKDVVAMKLAAPLHDVGKVGIPDSVLRKEGPLDADEWQIMQTHATIGGKILSTSEHPIVKLGAAVALGHHERWDGTGYPMKLAGDAVPLAARIVALVDVYDALRSKRPYKPAWTHEDAMRTILEGDGRTSPEHFDPTVLAGFKRCAEDLNVLFESNPDKV